MYRKSNCKLFFQNYVLTVHSQYGPIFVLFLEGFVGFMSSSHRALREPSLLSPGKEGAGAVVQKVLGQLHTRGTAVR